MPRLSTLSSRLTSTGFKKTPVFIKIYTGTDFSSFQSTWTFSTGTISLRASTLPYHSFGNASEDDVATDQACNRTWPQRGGTNQDSGVAIAIQSIIGGALATTQVDLLTENMPIVFNFNEGASANISPGRRYYVKDINTNSFSVSTIPEGRPISVFGDSPISGSISFLTSSTGNIGYWINGVNMFNPVADDNPTGFLKFDNLRYNAAYETAQFFGYSIGQDLAGGHVSAILNTSSGYTSVASTSSVSVSTGTKVFIVNQVGLYTTGTRVEVLSTTTSTVSRLQGFITNINTTTRAVTINADTVRGSTGTFSSWKFSLLSGNYHYHSFSFENAWKNGNAYVSGPVGSTGTAEVSLIPYLNGTLRHADGHSKILGWSLDGYPVYGPYGYNQALDSNSGVRPMKSGYTTFTRTQDVDARVIDGVLETTQYPLGIFVQDYYFADIGDLDVYNGRYCVTPEYPEGTYAYFCSVDPETLLPAYPYVIGNWHKSTPVQGSQTTSDTSNGGGLAPKQTD